MPHLFFLETTGAGRMKEESRQKRPGPWSSALIHPSTFNLPKKPALFGENGEFDPHRAGGETLATAWHLDGERPLPPLPLVLSWNDPHHPLPVRPIRAPVRSLT